MINNDRLTYDQANGITIITPDDSARLARVRVELQRLNERLTLWSPPGYLDRVEQALNELRPMDMRGE
jgi:hypothetical protein